ncbi:MULTISPECIES: alpha-hydroxy acid oxidase [Bradyrhizobium]|uniref:(S)-mandelate dehydrogenase n=1 Tax=Bradyrhizobium brasilense TaxID=1419277 RepID=A0A1G7JLF2_9BRAD|nr:MULTISPECIES: alpha-hydroxy acid oxidase [Bradyrhizobium]MCA6104277.1 alpha-hydroxy-acid oxidizing protein [Bradyrhizobium australafricanum]MCC8971716.1 alpha-hydroxy-acid oxidizing protein [Bradyrhizobium brasilense]SDF25299.1 (S)-mandelate dehydrogenase [Bradyrhizobium brasilense]
MKFQANAHSIAEYRELARRALPRMIFDFCDGGADGENTLAGNRAALDAKRLLGSAPIDVGRRSQEVKLFGKSYAMPLIIGPTGLAAAAWPDGDIALARAAGRAGIPFVMSTAGTCTQDDVASAGDGSKWMQLYIFKDRAFSARIVDKAEALGFEAIEVTVDNAVAGKRLRDERNGFSLPFRWTPAKLAGLLVHPGWSMRMARAGAPQLKVMGEGLGLEKTDTIAALMQSQFDASISWDDIARLRDRWKKPLIVKGLLDPSHVSKALSVGVDGLVISNHGGRQLDGAVASIDVLPDFVAAAGGRLTLLIDSGFRTGSDIARALALGADAVQVGRATLYALAVGGEETVFHALGLLKAELDVAQALMGVARIEDFHPGMIRQPAPVPLAPRPDAGASPTPVSYLRKGT